MIRYEDATIEMACIYIKDMTDDPIEGRFYSNELQRVYKEENDWWRVKKVVKRRKRRNQKELSVCKVDGIHKEV